MFCMVSGGSGSGKSEFAENLAVLQHNKTKNKPLIYIATMMAFDEEARKKIERHKCMRKNKNFFTMECFTSLKNQIIPQYATVLLDCMSNMVANEMFSQCGAKKNTDNVVETIMEGVKNCLCQCENLIIVTNEIFSDGYCYDEETTKYIEFMGNINRKMAQLADVVVEVVYGIPIYHKKRNEEFM